MRAIRELPRVVFLVGAISLLNDSASEMLYPLIPLYLSSVLMAGPRALGLIEGIAEATSSLMKLFSGAVFDRTRRSKPWIVGGYGAAAFCRPLVSAVTAWPGLLAIRFVDRLAKGLRSSPRDALLASSVAPDKRGLAFGFHKAMDNAGAVIGPLVAFALLNSGWSLEALFRLSLVPGLLCLGLCLMVEESPVPPGTAAARFEWGVPDLPLTFRKYLVVLALFTLGNSSNMFLLLRAKELGLSNAQVPLAWSVVSLVACVLSTPLSGLSDGRNRKRFLICGWCAYGCFYAVLGLRPPVDLAYLLCLFGFYGVFLAATEGVEKAFVSDLVDSAHLGRAYGWFNLVAGAMLFPASVLFGWLYGSCGPAVAFGFAAACATAAAVILEVALP